jgi:hypothetical protein
MNIERHTYTIGDIAKGYKDNEESGVIAFDGKLNVRPAYQREFVYKDKQRNAVIDTINKGFPLNVMYWAKSDDGTFEVLDGQQRTISFCQYVNGEFSINNKFFHNLTDDEQEKILSYQLDIYVCEGSDKERLDWFETINIAGEKLTRQELLNINYTGTWLTDAKKKFSKTGCVAYKVASKYVKGSPIRQEYLETALKWISNDNIADYMAKHQHDINANELWLYFSSVIEWVKTTFGEKNYRREMQGLDWGRLYDLYHNNTYDTNTLETKIKELLENEEVTDQRGVYEYVLSGCNENLAKHLSKRQFSKTEIRSMYERQNGICAICGEWHPIEEMAGDHIIPWWRGGKTTFDNLQVVCKKCNLGKAGKMEKKE